MINLHQSVFLVHAFREQSVNEGPFVKSLSVRSVFTERFCTLPFYCQELVLGAIITTYYKQRKQYKLTVTVDTG